MKNRGFSLIELMISTSFAIILIAGAFKLVQDLSVKQADTSSLFQSSSMVENIKKLIKRDLKFRRVTGSSSQIINNTVFVSNDGRSLVIQRYPKSSKNKNDFLTVTYRAVCAEPDINIKSELVHFYNLIKSDLGSNQYQCLQANLCPSGQYNRIEITPSRTGPEFPTYALRYFPDLASVQASAVQYVLGATFCAKKIANDLQVSIEAFSARGHASGTVDFYPYQGMLTTNLFRQNNFRVFEKIED